MKIKVITLKQPWAELVILGAKKIETRDWKPSPKMWKEINSAGGDLYIHASKTFHYDDWELCKSNKYFKNAIPDPSKLLMGAIIGKVKLVGFRSTNEMGVMHGIHAQEKSFGNYSADRWLWYLTKPERLARPIETNGSLSIWDYDLIFPVGCSVEFELEGKGKSEIIPGTVEKYADGEYSIKTFFGTTYKVKADKVFELRMEVVNG